jgi:hypothetical protein
MRSRQETIRRRTSKGSISQCEDHISRSCRLRFHCKEWIVELTDATDKNSCVVYFDFPGSVDGVVYRSIDVLFLLVLQFGAKTKYSYKKIVAYPPDPTRRSG